MATVEVGTDDAVHTLARYAPFVATLAVALVSSVIALALLLAIGT